MAQQSSDLCILYRGEPIGLYKDGVIPLAPGTYPYVPFRSLPHLRMCEAVGAGERPRCGFDIDGDRISFDVVAIPEAHRLTLDGFQRNARRPDTPADR